MCDKALNSYPSTIQFVPDSAMCNKAVVACPFIFDSVVDEFKNRVIKLFWGSFYVKI